MSVEMEYEVDSLVVVGEVVVGEVNIGEVVAAYLMGLPRGLVGEVYWGIFFRGSLSIVPSLEVNISFHQLFLWFCFWFCYWFSILFLFCG